MTPFPKTNSSPLKNGVWETTEPLEPIRFTGETLFLPRLLGSHIADKQTKRLEGFKVPAVLVVSYWRQWLKIVG